MSEDILCLKRRQEIELMYGLPEDINPGSTSVDLKKCLTKNYRLRKGTIEPMFGYDDLNFHLLPEVNDNPLVEKLCPYGYTVKVMNTKDSLNEGYCEAQNDLLIFLRENCIPSPKIITTASGCHYFKGEFSDTPSAEREVHILRVFEFQPGVTLRETPKSLPLFYRLGQFLGNLDEVLKKFKHKFYETHKTQWHLISFPEVKEQLEVIEDPERRELVESVIEEFVKEVEEKEESLEKGMIHGDFNEHNILMTSKDETEWEVSGILDFGDSHYSNYLFELAIAMCYMMIECKGNNLDPFEGARHFLAGYLKVRPSFILDIPLLKTCICARLCQSLVLGLQAFKIQPENEYVLSTQKAGWETLRELRKVSEEDLTKKWDPNLKSYEIKGQTPETP